MKYKGTELVEVVEPQIYSPPKLMLVWDDCDVDSILKGDYDLKQVNVYGIIDDTGSRVVSLVNGNIELFEHCAEIPEEPKPRMATNRELAKWLAQGKGEWGKSVSCKIERVEISWWYEWGYESEYLQKEIRVRKWDDTEWHEPDVQYMGIEE